MVRVVPANGLLARPPRSKHTRPQGVYPRYDFYLRMENLNFKNIFFIIIFFLFLDAVKLTETAGEHNW